VAKTGVAKGAAKEVRAVKEPVAKEPVAKKAVSKETAAKHAATTHSVNKQSATKEKVTLAKEPVAKETVVKEPLVSETMAPEPVANEPLGREPGGKEARVAKVAVKHVREEVPAAEAPDGKADVVGAEAHKGHRARPAVAKGADVTDGAGGDHGEPREQFLEHQRVLLMAERRNYTRQAEELRAQAEALALEHEPGDVQFDEEGGEGGTANVDRELDLHLSAQAQAAIEEIDAALDKITAGTYGFCESCGSPVPKARLEALPHARLCVSCKSGGLSARRQ
jgi:DnaK suppressor protein